VTTAPWRAAGADISDFFNYGLTERSWRQYQAKVARFRAAYDVRNSIKVLTEGVEEQLAGLPAELVAAVRRYRSTVRDGGGWGRGSGCMRCE
jgi:pre-mRNA 3'-end-processing factor FIP1